MTTALIGFTGFVGSNLLAQHRFDATFNSKTISEICGQSFDTIVCAAAPATMWAANKFPEDDLANIRMLVDRLAGAKAGRLVLISTIAVLADAEAGLDETTTRFETARAYGRNRRFLESACAGLGARTHILRLPALFGPGLRKNFLFDILNPVPSFLTEDRYRWLAGSLPPAAAAILARVYRFAADVGMYQCDRGLLAGPDQTVLTEALFAAGFTALDFTHADSCFQYYDLARLWSDITLAITHDLPLVHLAPAPLRAGDIHAALTGREMTARTAPLYREDMRTRHDGLWGGPTGYIQSGDAVLAALRRFHAQAHPR